MSALLAPKQAPARYLHSVTLQDELRQSALAFQWAAFLAAIRTGDYRTCAKLADVYRDVFFGRDAA